MAVNLGAICGRHSADRRVTILVSKSDAARYRMLEGNETYFSRAEHLPSGRHIVSTDAEGAPVYADVVLTHGR